jgi:hypothetical protein
MPWLRRRASSRVSRSVSAFFDVERHGASYVFILPTYLYPFTHNPTA